MQDLSDCNVLWFVVGQGVRIVRRSKYEVLEVAKAILKVDPEIYLQWQCKTLIGPRKFSKWVITKRGSVNDELNSATGESRGTGLESSDINRNSMAPRG